MTAPAENPDQPTQGTPATTPEVQDAGNVTRPADPPEVTEAEGEEIATTDPQALAKFQRREQRLKRERDTARNELKTLREQQQAKEQQMADEAQAQTAQQLADLTRERDEARREAETLRLERQLDGKVLDPEAALSLMKGGYRKEDGSLDVEGFLAKYPSMRPATSPTAPDGGGGPQGGGGKEAEIESVQKQLDAAEKAGNRVLAVSLQSRLTELRRTT